MKHVQRIASTTRMRVPAEKWLVRAATQVNCATGAFTTIVFDEKIFEFGSGYDETTGTFTAPKTGWYYINGNVVMAVAVIGAGVVMYTSLWLNGAALVWGTLAQQAANIAAGYLSSNVGALVYMEKDDYIRCRVYHALGAAWNTNANDPSCHLSIFEVV